MRLICRLTRDIRRKVHANLRSLFVSYLRASNAKRRGQHLDQCCPLFVRPALNRVPQIASPTSPMAEIHLFNSDIINFSIDTCGASGFKMVGSIAKHGSDTCLLMRHHSLPSRRSTSSPRTTSTSRSTQPRSSTLKKHTGDSTELCASMPKALDFAPRPKLPTMSCSGPTSTSTAKQGPTSNEPNDTPMARSTRKMSSRLVSTSMPGAPMELPSRCRRRST